MGSKQIFEQQANMPLLSNSAYGIVLLVLIMQVGTGGK